MNYKKITGSILAASLLLSGCSSQGGSSNKTASIGGDIAVVTNASSETVPTPAAPTAEKPKELFEFNPHLHLTFLEPDVPQSYFEALDNLSDALRNGDDTFECGSEEAYKWCMDITVLANLIPAASVRVTSKSSDGSVPYENGVGRIYYNMPKDEFVKRQSEFEQKIVDVLNNTIEKDDDDYEKCLKLYEYMEKNYTYEHERRTDGSGDNGYLYYTFTNHTGVCIDLSAVYSYLLLQAGVQATSVGCVGDGVDHEWVYAIVNGKGYYIDPTWGLMSETGIRDLKLDYFMMTADEREYTGCPVNNLHSGLLPKYWFSNSQVSLDADDDSLFTGRYTFFKSLDEDNKIITYIDENNMEQQKNYG